MSEVTPIASVRQGENFLKRMFGNKPDDTSILIWTMPGNTSYWYTRLPTQTRINELVSKNVNVYFGLGLAPQGLSKYNRCKAEDIRGINCMWADIDFDSGVAHKKEDLPPNLDAALELVKASPFEPSYVVCSGNGVHAYWLFDEPWIFKDGDEWKKAEELSQRWNQLFKNAAAEHGWSVDSVFDLARILRVPGTKNFKSDTPKDCYIISESDATVTVKELWGVVPDIPPQAEKQREDKAKREKAAPKGDYGFILRADARPDVEKLEILISNNPEFDAYWNKKLEPKKDKSPSGWDMILTHKLVAAGWKDQEIVDALLYFRRTKLNADMKMHRPDYYRNTLNKARSYARSDGAAQELESIQTERTANNEPISEDQKKAILMNLSNIFRIKLTGVEKYLEDPPIYYLKTDRGTMLIGTVDKIVSQTNFRYVLAAACGVAIQNYKGPQWTSIVQSILDVCEDVSIGEESTEEGEMRMYITEYLSERRPFMDHNEAFRTKAPFQFINKKTKEDSIYIFATQFAKWLKLTHMRNMTLRQIGRLMKRIGSTSEKLNFWPKGGQRTTTTVWKLDNETFGELLQERIND